MKKFVALLLAVLMVASLCACGQKDTQTASDIKTVTAGKLTMSTNAQFPPYESVADDGKGYEGTGFEGIDIEVAQAIAEKLAEHDAVDRFSTWPTPVAMSIIEIGVEYGKGWALGEITDRNNADILMELFNESVPGAKIENYTNAEGTTLDNYYTILLSQVDFNDYL